MKSYRVRNLNTGRLARLPGKSIKMTYEEALRLHFALGSAQVPSAIEVWEV